MVAIVFRGLTKKYGATVAVDNFSAEVRSARVTGFLGPNGAGKSTALRCLVGLATPTKGRTRILGKRYHLLEHPLQRVGVVLDSRGFHPGLTAVQNLRVMATMGGIARSRIAEVLGEVELTDAGDTRVKGFSLGMTQRLSLAAAILGKPEVLILDEPGNGLDPAGIAWLRRFISRESAAGTTVLVSSHQLAQLEGIVDDVIIITKGKLVTSGTLDEVTQGESLEEAFLRRTGGEKE